MIINAYKLTLRKMSTEYGLTKMMIVTSELTRKVAKASLVVIITSVIVFIAMTVINSVYAPDVIMLKSIMSSMK